MDLDIIFIHTTSKEVVCIKIILPPVGRRSLQIIASLVSREDIISTGGRCRHTNAPIRACVAAVSFSLLLSEQGK